MSTQWYDPSREERQIEQYHTLVNRVRKHNPAAQIGQFSSHEITRLERLARQLEDAAAMKVAGDVEKFSDGSLNLLWQRGQAAEQRILRAQRDVLTDRKIFDLLGVPETYLDPPRTMRRLPVQRTAEDIDHFAKQVTELEVRASRLDDIVQSFERLTPEQQTRRLLMCVAERLMKLEEKVKTDGTGKT
jgi:hypothetical protein